MGETSTSMMRRGRQDEITGENKLVTLDPLLRSNSFSLSLPTHVRSISCRFGRTIEVVMYCAIHLYMRFSNAELRSVMLYRQHEAWREKRGI